MLHFRAPLRCAHAFGREEISFLTPTQGSRPGLHISRPFGALSSACSSAPQDRTRDLDQGEALAQVNAADFGVVAELLGRTSAEDAAIINDVAAIGDGK